MNPVHLEKFLRRAQCLVRIGDNAVFDTGKNPVARFGRFRNLTAGAALEVFPHRRRWVDAVAVKDFKRVAIRRRVRRTRTRGDVGGIVTRNVRNDECEHGCFACRREPASLNR